MGRVYVITFLKQLMDNNDESLKTAYRILHGRYVELQIELEGQSFVSCIIISHLK